MGLSVKSLRNQTGLIWGEVAIRTSHRQPAIIIRKIHIRACRNVQIKHLLFFRYRAQQH
jgi:hypothetical protein